MNDYKKYIFCIMLLVFLVKSSLSQERFIFDTLDNWLTIGTFDSDIKKNIGLPDSVSNSEIWEFTGAEYQYWYYKDLGLTLLLEKKDSDISVYSIELISEIFCTTMDVKIGDTRDDVILKYKDFVDVNDTDCSITIVNNIYEGTFFLYSDKILRKIIIGSIAE
ncbi:MAG: hypothetical protein IKJ67_04910 [Bacteroidales bacterium]|nr:hypothetical protein [Bacteroidales bacterium]